MTSFVIEVANCERVVLFEAPCQERIEFMAPIFREKGKWEITLTDSDLDIINPTKEEILDLICASLPYAEIRREIRRLSAYVVKTMAYGKSVKGWQIAIKHSVAEIRETNTRRRAKGVYFDLGDMRAMLTRDWADILNRVVNDSDSVWSTSVLRKKVSISLAWEQIAALGLDRRK